MIWVDSSVWIDDFRGTATPQAEKLDANRVIGDWIMFYNNQRPHQARIASAV